MSDERRDAQLVDAIERPGQDAELERDAAALRAVLAQTRDVLPSEEPPATLDARILAAARVAADAARARDASTGWRRWLRSPALGLALVGGMAAIVAVVVDPAALRAPTTETASLRDAPPPAAPAAQGAPAPEPANTRAEAAAPTEPTRGDAPSGSAIGGLGAEEGAERERAMRGALGGRGRTADVAQAPAADRGGAERGALAPADKRFDETRSSRAQPAAIDAAEDLGPRAVATRDEKPAASAATLDGTATAEAKKASAPAKEAQAAKEERAAKDAWGLVGDGTREQPKTPARDDEADADRPAMAQALAAAPTVAPRTEPARAKGKADDAAAAVGPAATGDASVGSSGAAPPAPPRAASPRRASSEQDVAALPAPSDAAVAAMLAEAARESSAGRAEQAASTLEAAARKATREPDRGLVALRRAELALAMGRPAEAQVHAQVAGRSPSAAIVARARVVSAQARAAAP